MRYRLLSTFIDYILSVITNWHGFINQDRLTDDAIFGRHFSRVFFERYPKWRDHTEKTALFIRSLVDSLKNIVHYRSEMMLPASSRSTLADAILSCATAAVKLLCNWLRAPTCISEITHNHALDMFFTRNLCSTTVFIPLLNRCERFGNLFRITHDTRSEYRKEMR